MDIDDTQRRALAFARLRVANPNLGVPTHTPWAAAFLEHDEFRRRRAAKPKCGHCGKTDRNCTFEDHSST
ncbi:MAG: hypothetical protein ABL908_03765 [Hyphomicrobium sp.]